MTALAEAVDRLRARGTPFALVGAAALALHGVPRSTRDLDLLTVDVRCLDDEFRRSIGAGAIEVTVQRGDADDPLAGIARLRPTDGAPVRRRRRAKPVAARRAGAGAPRDRRRCRGAGRAGRRSRAVEALRGRPQDLWDGAQLPGGDDAAAIVADVERRLPALPAECARLWAQVSRPRRRSRACGA